MPDEFFWILLIAHVICALIYVSLIFLGRSHLRKEYIIPIVMVPIFGPLMALAIDISFMTGDPGHRTVEFEALRLENDIYWKSLKHTQENTNVIPLEEAILLNDVKTRRKVMLETLEEDPLPFMGILMVARDNDDTETVHYATTQISKEQRYFQLELQKFAVDIENDPDNVELLNSYLNTFDRYLSSGLLENTLLTRQRIIYSNLLDKKLALVENDRDTLIKKLKNFIALKNFTAANEVSDTLKTLWPEDEESWIESLRVCVESKDQVRFNQIVEDIKRTDIDWTRQGREKVKYWANV